MINISDKDYAEKTSVLRAKQAWNKEKKTEKKLEQEYQLLFKKIERELADLYAVSEDGVVSYNRLTKKLTNSELIMYKNRIQEIISQNSDIEDEETVLNLKMLMEYTDINQMDSKINTIDAHLLVTQARGINIVTDSLYETFEDIHSYTNYDIQRKQGIGKVVEKKDDEWIKSLLFLSWTGMAFDKAIKSSRHRLTRDIRKSVESGIRRSDNYSTLGRRLKDLVSGGKGYKSIRSTLRGETTRTIASTALETYKSAGLEKYQFIATLDDRTTEVCSGLDLDVFNIDDAEIGVNKPPMHFGCRSTTSPFFEFDDMSESPRKARDQRTNTNYEINADISYTEWNKQFN